MKTIGRIIKESRIKRKYSLRRVEEETKIKKEYIDKIEKEIWASLPDFPVVAGFVRNIASFLKIDEKSAVAILKRDYPPRPISINPKPDVSTDFIWSPKMTFLTGVGIVLVLIFGYLTIQYMRFVNPPRLIVERPKEGEVVTERELIVLGQTDTDATVKVNNQSAIVGPEGDFETTIEVSENTSEVAVEARSRAGRETVVRRKIKPEFK